jgi:D-glucuronyl C5-epimerase C-terminus
MRVPSKSIVLAVVAAAVVAPAPAVAAVTPQRDARLVRRGVAHAVKQHWLKADEAQRYRTDVAVAVRDVHSLPPLRAQVIAAQLAQLTTVWDSYTSPRALALFTQLEQNLAYLETHRVPSQTLDVADQDGVVYRWFAGQGLEFHPLAAFSALNNLAARKNADATRTLADALVARGIPHGSRLVWEYAFRFGGGRPPWASGMAQAVAAQALGRAGALLQDDDLLGAAARAYASVPPLTLALPSGPWIRLYAFNHEIVLNAQLQTILSLLEYARTPGASGGAGALAQRLDAAAQALLPRFDTGDWSRYELGGGYAPRSYQLYVTNLLAKLSAVTQEPAWGAAAQRFHAYYYDPPQVTQPAAPAPIYPRPRDGYLDTASIKLTLSQRASVVLAVGGQVLTFRLGRGTHTVTWKPPLALAPGTYPVQVAATSYAGRRATVKLAPVVVDWDTAPPAFAVLPQLQGTTLSWQANDPGTPWLAFRVALVDPAGVNAPQTLQLGHQPTTGSVVLPVPPGTWTATLQATNSAGLTTSVPLGTVTA